MDAQATRQPEKWPGEQLGLPESGPGSLASWGQRIAALIVDWAACSLIAFLIGGAVAINGQGWERFAVLIMFFVESAALTAIAGWQPRPVADPDRGGPARRAAAGLESDPPGADGEFGIAALIIGPHRRGLQDLACDTVVVRRR